MGDRRHNLCGFGKPNVLVHIVEKAVFGETFKCKDNKIKRSIRVKAGYPLSSIQQCTENSTKKIKSPQIE